jgi:hypothetical protein
MAKMEDSSNAEALKEQKKLSEEKVQSVLKLLKEQYELEEKLAKLHGRDADEAKTALRNRKELIKRRLEEAKEELSPEE